MHSPFRPDGSLHLDTVEARPPTCDLEAARREQFRSVQLVRLLASHGYMGASKAAMAMLGVDVGPARLTAPRRGGRPDAVRG